MSSSAFDAAAILSEVTGTDCHIAPFTSSAAHTFRIPTPPGSPTSASAPGQAEAAAVAAAAEPVVEIVDEAETHVVAPSPPDFGFLVLVPVQSGSYPSAPVVSSVPKAVLPASADAAAQRTSRSSSVSSNGLSPYRFLKLGPVHYGGVPGATDYASIDEE